MASRNKVPIKALSRELVAIKGSFAPNGSSAVAASSRKGLGFTVARTSAGLFTITLSDKWLDIISVNATLQQATAGDQIVQVGTISVSSKTVQIRVWDISDAAVADVAADANNRINFEICCSNTSLKPALG